MKCIMIFVSVAVLLLAGCEYESPLTKEHSIAVDSAVLGVWERILDKGEEPTNDERMIILKYSDTEYLINYPNEDKILYFRAYPIRIGEVSCVQLQVIGTNNGPPNPFEKDLFHVASYQLTDNRLKIETINTDLIDYTLKTEEQLREAFEKHQDSRDLFNNPRMFRRIEEDPSLF